MGHCLGPLVVAFVVGCGAGDPPSSPGEADAAAPSTPVASPGPSAQAEGHANAPGCLDWSGLDLASLPPLPNTPHTATFERVWELVRTKHFDPTLGCVDWPAQRLAHGTRLGQAQDAATAYEIMNDLLGELGQSHFGLIAPDDRVPEDPDAGPARPRIQVRWIEKRLTVVRSEEPQIPMGAIVDTVNGQSLDELVHKSREASSRPAEVAFKIGRAVDAKLACRAGASHRLGFLHPGRNDTRVQRKARCELPQGELVTLGNLKNIPTKVAHRMIDGTQVGYLAFNVWMLPMVARLEAAMADLRAQGMTTLVLDLRGNPGGVGPMSVPVARLMLRDGGNLGRLQFREFANEFNVGTNPDPFGGAVVVLVDEGTASTSEIFAAGMRDLGRIEVIGGGPSAGAALPSLIEELTGGAVLQYVVGDYHSPRGTVVEGVGVIPDRVIVERRADFVAGKDPVLDAAVAHLQSKLE